MKKHLYILISAAILKILFLQDSKALTFTTESEILIKDKNSLSNTKIIKSSKEVSLTIPEIQGTSDASPYVGQVVSTEGLVTGDFQRSNELKGYFLQDTLGDNNPATSDGIFILDSISSVNIGDYIKITGTVVEYRGLTQLQQVTILSTELTGLELANVPLLSIPTTSNLETFEGMLVKFDQLLTVINVNDLAKNGEITLSASGRLFYPSEVLDPNDIDPSGNTSTGITNVAAIKARQKSDSSQMIILDDASRKLNPTNIKFINDESSIRVGTTLNGFVGIVDFDGYYKIQTVEDPLPFVYADRPGIPVKVTNNVNVTYLNLDNFFNGEGDGSEEGFPTAGAKNLEQYELQTTKIVQAISTLNADIIVLGGVENDGNTPSSAITELTTALNNLIGLEKYKIVSDPEETINPASSPLLKQAILYNPARVLPVGNAIADKNSQNFVPSIAQEFSPIGKTSKLLIIASQFEPRACDEAAGNDINNGDAQECFNNKRKLQSTALIEFSKSLIESTSNNKVLTLGNFNAFSQEDPIDLLRASNFEKLMRNEYTIVYNGLSGALDHAFVSPSLSPEVVDAKVWHVNSDEPAYLNFSDPLYLSTDDYFKFAEHDPLFIGINLTDPTNVILSNDNAASFTISPNPAKDIVSFKWKSLISSHGELTIKNSLNKEIVSISQEVSLGNNEINIPVSNLKSGIYYVNITTQNTFLTGRFIVAE